jgi:sulfide:quinone oxidoreductase
MIRSQKLTGDEYNGYSSCPLVTGYGKMVLAEFDYSKDFKPDPKLKGFPFFLTDSSKEHWRLWVLKKYVLPYLYWNKMMKGVKV